MELVRFGSTDLQVSPLCLGAMNFGMPGWGCDEATAAEIVGVFRDAGGNFFDTAELYGRGESERILGRVLAECRDEVIIASKVGFRRPGQGPRDSSPRHLRTALEGTLTRLSTDYLDLYQLHAFDPEADLDETLGGLHELVDDGLVRHAGCSNFFAWQIAHADGIARSRSLHGLASAQMMYSLVRRDLEREHFACVESLGLALIAYGPLHGGHLAAGWRSRADVPDDSRAALNPDVYLSDEDRLFTVTEAVIAHADQIDATPGQVALAWVSRNPLVTTTLTAARSRAELREQLRALSLDASADFWASLDEATRLPPSYPADFYARMEAREPS